MSFMGWLTGEDKAKGYANRAINEVSAGKAEAVGDGTFTGGSKPGAIQQGYGVANGFLQGISDKTKAGSDAWDTASGVNGFARQGQMANDFLGANGPLKAAIGYANDQVLTNQNARGLSMSGANAAAQSLTASRLGLDEWHRQQDLFKASGDQWINAQGSQANLAQQTGQSIGQADMSAAAAKAGQYSQLAASAASFSPLNAFATFASAVGNIGKGAAAIAAI